MMTTHTPGPLSVLHDNDPLDGATFIQDVNGNRIAQVYRFMPGYEEHAAFIVRACNAHAELVKVLKAILDSGRYDDAGNFTIDCEPWDGQGEPPDTTDPLCIQAAWALIEAEAKAEGRAES